MTRPKSSPTKTTRDLTTIAWFSSTKDPEKVQALGSQGVKVGASDAMDVESIHSTNADGQDPGTPHQLRQKKPALKTVKNISPLNTPNGGKERPTSNGGISNPTQADGPNGIPAKNLEDAPSVASLFEGIEPPTFSSLFEGIEPPTTSVTDENGAPSPAKVSAGSDRVHRESVHAAWDANKSPAAAQEVSAESSHGVLHRESDQAGVASTLSENISPGATEVSSESNGDQDGVASVTDETNYLAAPAEASPTNNGDQGVANVAEAVKSPAVTKASTKSNEDQDVASVTDETNYLAAPAEALPTNNGDQGVANVAEAVKSPAVATSSTKINEDQYVASVTDETNYLAIPAEASPTNNGDQGVANVAEAVKSPAMTKASNDSNEDQDVASVTDETNYLAAAEASPTSNGDQGVVNVAEAVKSPAVTKASNDSNEDQDVARWVAKEIESPTVADVSTTSIGESAQGARAPSKKRYYLSSDTEDDDYGLINSPSEPSDDDNDSDDQSEKTLAMAVAVADSTETAIFIDDSDDEELASGDNDVGEGDNEPVEPDSELVDPGTPPPMMESSDRETPTKRTPRKRGRPQGSLSSVGTGSSQAAKSKKDKRKSEAKPKRAENQKEKDAYFEPGYLVYGPWPGKKPNEEQWFWGRIERKFKKNHCPYFSYSVIFLDGDYSKEITAKNLMGVAEYRRLLETGLIQGTTPPSGEPDFPEGTEEPSDDGPGVEIDSGDDGKLPSTSCAKNSGALTPLELYQRRCKECERCLREECGECSICVQGAVGNQKECCFQKMCLAINLEDKAQHIEGTKGWRFAFDEEDENKKYRGLVILAPSHWIKIKRFKSLESAKRAHQSCHRNVDISAMHEAMGLSEKSLTEASLSIKREALSGRDSDSLLNLCQIWEKRCKACDNCKKDDCGQCQTCVQARGSSKTKSCLRRFCCLLSEKSKAQKAEHFPENWRFYFDPNHVSYSVNPRLDGLVLLAPNGRRYRSVKRAMRQSPAALGKLDPSPLNFYDYVGLDRNLDDGDVSTGVQSSRDSLSGGHGGLTAITTGSKKRSFPAEYSVTKRSKTIENEEVGTASHDQEPPMTPSELFVNRCKKCVLCIADDCGRCATCIFNGGRTRRFKEVCLRKMCLEIPLHRKKQPAVGFPPDWCYAFELPDDSSRNQDDLDRDPDLWGLRLVKHGGATLKWYTIGKARRRYTEALGGKTLPSFYEHIGASMYEEEPVHALLGQGYSREWINVAGKRRIIFGCITKAENHLFYDTKHLTVTYNDESRGLLNSFYTGTECGNIHIPPFDRVSEQDAWGGCILYNTKSGLHSNLDQKGDLLSVAPFHVSWIAPDMHREDQHYDGPNTDGSESIEPGLPRLTLVSGGFKLVFTVKPSTIPNAGYGVFLKCDALHETNSPQSLVLQPGQLLDFGVYAPFCAEDKKRDYIFLLKNFVHKFKCEGFCFETVQERNEHIFDITDDWTGDLHQNARRHVPAYVNEIAGDDEIPVVHSRHDSEGALHYLLGHDEESQGPFQLLADGVEKEIFIDYGPRYENVRVRSGYSRLPPDEATELLKRLQKEDQDEYLDEIRSFSAGELRSSIDFFYRLLTAGRPLNYCFVERSLIVVILLKKRAGAILEEFSGLTTADPESFCDNGATTIDLPKMVSDCGGLVNRLFDQWGNDQAMMERLLADDIFNAVLHDALGESRLDQLSSREFRLRLNAKY